MVSFTINGKTIQMEGSSVAIRGNKVYVDGKLVDMDSIPDVQTLHIHGDVKNVVSDKAVNVTGNVSGSVESTGAVNCGNVGGNVLGSAINCSDVNGDVVAKTVNCGDVAGNVSRKYPCDGLDVSAGSRGMSMSEAIKKYAPESLPTDSVAAHTYSDSRTKVESVYVGEKIKSKSFFQKLFGL